MGTQGQGSQLRRWQPPFALVPNLTEQKEMHRGWGSSAEDIRELVVNLWCNSFGAAKRSQGGISNRFSRILCHSAWRRVLGPDQAPGLPSLLKRPMLSLKPVFSSPLYRVKGVAACQIAELERPLSTSHCIRC